MFMREAGRGPLVVCVDRVLKTWILNPEMSRFGVMCTVCSRGFAMALIPKQVIDPLP